jgi:hypothetical protein
LTNISQQKSHRRDHIYVLLIFIASTLPWWFLFFGLGPDIDLPEWLIVIFILLLLVIVPVVALFAVFRLKLFNSVAHDAVIVFAVLMLTEGLFAWFYLLLSDQSSSAAFCPAHPSHIQLLYFTISTATTTGMADIKPNNDSARILVSAQMLVSLILISGAIATAFNRVLNLKD